MSKPLAQLPRNEKINLKVGIIWIFIPVNDIDRYETEIESK